MAHSRLNVFVLCTGRCGSVTFAKACSHAANFTVGHESRARISGRLRLRYPRGHIEVDNRLSWFLGRLESKYGNNAYYVHLFRNAEETAVSLNKRWHLHESIMRAYADQIHMARPKDPMAMCRDYIQTVTENIELFLRDKKNVSRISLETVRDLFPEFWTRIGAEGDLASAIKEWNTKHNASQQR